MEKTNWRIPPNEIPNQKIIKEEIADIIIIGAGYAGTCATRAATEIQGSHVIVIETQSNENQRIIGSGEVGHINSKWQQKHQVPIVDVDEFTNDWQLRTNNKSDYQLVRTFAEKCGEAFDWYIQPLENDLIRTIYPMMTPASPNMPKSLNGIKSWPGTAKMPIATQNKALKINQQVAKVEKRVNLDRSGSNAY
ncbi:FAD-binding protein [Eubacteriaceae bacterium ES2]|nr:FAD-binding protein [Eubacteriaceae bacterium ES2]